MLKTLTFRSGSLASNLRAFSCKAGASQNAQNDVTSTHLQSSAIRLYGQPTAESHPHLLPEGQLTPGMTVEEYRNRRCRLMESVTHFAEHITAETASHLVIIPSATKVFMSANIPYPFRQNSDFLYLTGFLEPDSVLLLRSQPAGKHQSVMFVPKRDPNSELWDGPRAGADGAVTLLGVDEAYSLDELPNFLSAILRDSKSFALWCSMQDCPQPFVQRSVKAITDVSSPKYLNSHHPLLQQLRLFKSPAEVALMTRSCKMASEGFVDVIAYTKPMVEEHHLYAKMDYECRIRGADRLAYPPVIAGGDRANIIHYVINNQVLLDGEMVLMDAGCEYGGYVSDITRTWPVSNKFSPPHRELYEALLEVQDRLLIFCKDRLSIDQLYHKMNKLLEEKLQEIGVIQKSASAKEKLNMVNRFCPHNVGHYLGMDVHDTPLVPRSMPIQPGMVITIEPGIYISREDQSVPPEYRGVGIRIEDNVLITKDGIVVLSAKCPKTVADIEAIRNN